ncbi:response regulator transcription factor [Ramlibacter sp. AN1133]|uniref:response regulator transcription factor n=1 Tax=Ramlibacter sp. AN1133 TaxID=3133429 RepID=UPI0030C17C28
MRIEVLLANEHPVVRAGLRALVACSEDLAVAGEAADGRDTLDMVRVRDWGLVMLDLTMPGRSGLELIKLIKAERPRLPVLVFSAQREELYALRAIRAGALGYLSLRADPDTVICAMRRAAAGRIFVSPEVTELLASHSGDALPHDRLTDREYCIFSRIVHGASLSDIADELSLSIKTVSTHKSHILDKMTLAGQVELVRYAIEHKLLGTVSE